VASKATSLHTIINELVERTNSGNQRMRNLEQREESLLARMDTAEQDLLSINQSISKITKDLEGSIKARDAKETEIRNTIKEIIAHLKTLAPKEKLSELEALIDIYSPLKSSFITREEAENMIDEKLSRLKTLNTKK
jgi:hypothetical protein